MLSTPKISVVMSAYNAAAYLDEAVSSILHQTFRDFEFIIINNGSTDDTGAMLDKYRRQDSRIRVYYHEQQGLARALNAACGMARGQYIALMDADDVSLAHRLARQTAFMENHPQIGIVGTWISKLKNGSVTRNWCPSTSPKMLKWSLFFGICVSTPSIMMRRDIVSRLTCPLRSELLHAEDVDLWFRASKITEFGCVSEVLYQYRVWPGSSTQLHLQIVRETHVRLLASFIKDFLESDPSMEAVAGLRQTRIGTPFKNLGQIRSTAALIQKLHDRFLRENSMTFEERREISWDAAKRIGSLALQASRFAARDFLSLSMRAVKLDYRLIHPSAIMKGLERRRAFNFATQAMTRGEEELDSRCARSR
ncbi:MAG: glycosyltransferase family 2 protein [Candidatus Binatia bacterium]